jgi:hypothetical protein
MDQGSEKSSSLGLADKNRQFCQGKNKFFQVFPEWSVDLPVYREELPVG